MKNLGFGMMRLPVISGPTDFDYQQLNDMVDAFLEVRTLIRVLYITTAKVRRRPVRHWSSVIQETAILSRQSSQPL